MREVPFSGNLILTFQHKGKVLFLRPYSAVAAGCQLGVIQCQGVGRRIIVRRGAVTVGITQNVAGVGAGDGDAVHLYRIRLYPGCFYFSLAHRTNPVCYLMHSVLVFFGAALCRAGFPVMCAVAGPVFRPDMLVLHLILRPAVCRRVAVSSARHMNGGEGGALVEYVICLQLGGRITRKGYAA